MTTPYFDPMSRPGARATVFRRATGFAIPAGKLGDLTQTTDATRVLVQTEGCVAVGALVGWQLDRTERAA